MISILVQERVLGAALGSVFVGALVLEQRRGIYRSLPDDTSVRYELQECIFGKNSSDFVHMWNKAVDETLGPVVAYLSSRRW
ncbi:putative 60S ribosomal protein L44 [Cocos nucifera]|uniref:Putative 60S ribosomal protein L44 n=1 Tax=Cocos nucifera TaxID=13894 RepID=A0A8K0IEA0_COCNU|nr:putative 60S ribosomal protein L44 [Cocos nucifera]